MLLTLLLLLANTPPLTTTLLDHPCRYIDTRDEVTLVGEGFGPIAFLRFYRVQGGVQGDGCGVPIGAQGLILTVTATEASDFGHLVLWGPTLEVGLGIPPTSNLNFTPGAGAVASGATVRLAEVVDIPSICPICPAHISADLGILPSFATYPGSVHVIIDIVGYLEEEEVAP